MSARAVISGIGAYVPERVLTNVELERMVDTSDEWIRTRTGIVERRIVSPGENVSDMAVCAAEEALKDAGMNAVELDLIITATSSPEMIMPASASIIQAKLGAVCPAFDLMAACSGFVYGLSVVDQFIRSGTYDSILLVGSDALSRHVDWTDRSTCVLFGDGAGAVVVRSTGDAVALRAADVPEQESRVGAGILSSYLSADGKGADFLKIPAGASAKPGSEESVTSGQHFIKMNGKEVFKFAARAIPEAIEKALEMAGLTTADVDHLILHQANRRIIDAAVERLDIDPQKAAVNIERYGNTSTASIPLVLYDLDRSGKLREGDIVVFVGFGAGLTSGANVIRWGKGG